jgi:amino acid transporter
VSPRPQVTLKRSLSLPLITLYGVGTTIGAGIFVLVGKVAGAALIYAPVSFLLAAVLAGFSAFAFAELSARYPQSAGEAVYVYEGLGSRRLALAVGLLVVLAGIVSCATIANGFVGYVQLFLGLPDAIVLVAVVLVLGLIAAWGIAESVILAAVLTLLEIGALILVIWAGRDSLAELPARLPELIPPLAGGAWLGIVSGAVLAFYAFIGFEDMVNVAEEVKDVRRTLPRAIILTLVVTTLLYLALAVVAVLVLPVQELAASEAPVALIYERASGSSAAVVSLIAIVAVLNGALVQVIMAARVLYGLSARAWLPEAFARINPATRTPLVATALVTALILVFALALPLVTLARTTSFVTLVIFAAINLALWRIKGRAPAPPGIGVYPRWVCLCGFLASLGLASFQAIAAITG